MSIPEKSLDVLVVGAGLSGVSAAYRLKDSCPNQSFLVVEARARSGGTWDLFRYPGIRSDSDMYTFGFPFEPWSGPNTVAHGETIRDYVKTTLRKHDLDRFICYNHKLVAASWNSGEKRWQVIVESDKTRQTWTSRFLWLCTGYYDYEEGHQPDIPGLDRFQGPVVHPQHWPEHLDYDGQKVVVIGSGATAVTLVPALARSAELVTMLQRSPSYVSEVPSQDPWAGRLRKYLPLAVAAWLLRWKGVFYQTVVFQLARRFPEFFRRLLTKPWSQQFGEEFAQEHFNPRYNPWEQRLCVDSDGELAQALEEGRARIITDRISTCLLDGIELESGRKISADLIVTATGLKIQLLGASEITVDGRAVTPAEHLVYKGLMLDNLPNLFLSLGYTNMSWTLKCDLISRYVCRLLNFMEKGSLTTCRPIIQDSSVEPQELIDFNSGYFQRAGHLLPKQGNKGPWKLHQSYIHDILQTSFAPLRDGVMKFED